MNLQHALSVTVAQQAANLKHGMKPTSSLSSIIAP